MYKLSNNHCQVSLVFKAMACGQIDKGLGTYWTCCDCRLFTVYQHQQNVTKCRKYSVKDLWFYMLCCIVMFYLRPQHYFSVCDWFSQQQYFNNSRAAGTVWLTEWKFSRVYTLLSPITDPICCRHFAFHCVKAAQGSVISCADLGFKGNITLGCFYTGKSYQ